MWSMTALGLAAWQADAAPQALIPIIGASDYGSFGGFEFTNLWQRLLFSVLAAVIVAVIGEIALRVLTRFRHH
jgi:hypothetical protein